MRLTEVNDPKQWDDFVDAHAFGHPLQSWAWGELKRQNGWRPVRLLGEEGVGAQVLLWPIPNTKRTVAYVPRGPLAVPSSRPAMELLGELGRYAKTQKALYLRIEPAWKQGDMPAGWRRSRDELLLSRTYTVDLTKPEEELMAAMRSKTRQYIRAAEKAGVTIMEVDQTGDLTDFWRIYQDTAKRVGFGIHELSYYQSLQRQFGAASRLYYAKSSGRAEAFLWVVSRAGVAIELYGGVTAAGADAKANYLLKWQAMRQAKISGDRLYDFSGRLNEGVSQFKAGFGPDETDYVGTFDLPFSWLGYQLWTVALPLLKPLGRRFLKGGR